MPTNTADPTPYLHGECWHVCGSCIQLPRGEHCSPECIERAREYRRNHPYRPVDNEPDWEAIAEARAERHLDRIERSLP